MCCRRSCGPPAGSGPDGPDRRTTRWVPKARVCSKQRCAEIHVTNLQRFAPCQARSGEATISAAPWYRVGGRFRQSMVASGSSGGLPSRVGDDLRRRRFPRPTWRKSCLSVQSGHVGTGADGSPAGGSGSGGSHSDDRRLRLNAYGQIMLEHARRSISEINSATERIAALRDPDSGTVRLAFLHSLASWLVPDLLRRFRSAAPRVQFTLSQAAAYEMVEFLARGHVDLAITAPDLTEPGLDGTSCRSSACALWFHAITALPSAPDCASPKPPTNRSSHWVRNSQCVQVSTLKALEGDPNWVASVEELIDYDRTAHVPTRTRARPDGSDTERMEVCQPVSEASPASW